MQPTTITIDGPAASGKSTIGQMLADKLNYLYLDTGCMYRATTLAAINAGIDLKNEAEVTRLAAEIEMRIEPLAGQTDGRQYTVLLEWQGCHLGYSLPGSRQSCFFDFQLSWRAQRNGQDDSGKLGSAGRWSWSAVILEQWSCLMPV